MGTYRETAASLHVAFARPGTLDAQYPGPLGSASGAERLQIRLYDLLAHGWDLAQATGQPADLPDDIAEQSLAFVRTQLTEQARAGRFGPAQNARDNTHPRAAGRLPRPAAFHLRDRLDRDNAAIRLVELFRGGRIEHRQRILKRDTD